MLRHRWLRRRPGRGVVVLVVPTAQIRRVVGRALLVLVAALYLANFLLADLAIRPPLNRDTGVKILREFPVTTWGLYALLPADEVSHERLRLELPAPWEAVDFDGYVRRYPVFAPGVLHHRLHRMLERGRDLPARRLLRFLVDRYWVDAKLPRQARPNDVRVRVAVVDVSHGRLRAPTTPERIIDVPLPLPPHER
jgi:hypothetical protein